LIIMALLMAFLFLGTLGLTQYFKVFPAGSETILSALARGIFGTSFMYYLVQITTLTVLAVAANTAFSGFPRVAVFLAQDKFLPHQLKALGDRLVFTNGIIFLAAGTAAVLVLFGGDSHSLVPLFAIGAFMAFTFSQAGMVLHWIKEKGRLWIVKALLNGIGAFVTGAMLIVIGAGKFVQGAWMTFIAIPMLVVIFLRIERHYQEIAEELSLQHTEVVIQPFSKIRLVIPVSGIHKGILDAVQYALSISKNITAVYVEIEPNSHEKIQQKWKSYFPEIPLVVVSSPYRSIIGPLLDFLDAYDEASGEGTLAGVVIPEFVTTNFWENMLHNQMAWLIKFTLLYRRRRLGYQRVIIDVPYHLHQQAALPGKGTPSPSEIGDPPQADDPNPSI
jgi:hypothetical protein